MEEAGREDPRVDRQADPADSTQGGSGVDHAVVIGGGVAGLLTARALTGHFRRVTIVERDTLPAGPTFRPGVPQSRHLHVLLGRGLDAIEELLPGFQAAVLDTGAALVDWADALWLNAAGWSRRYPQPIRLLGASRELLEWQLRVMVADAGVRFCTGQEVTGLLASSDRGTVTGVRVRPHRGALPHRQVVPAGQRTTTEAIPADLVVDASGRTSKSADWLVTLGYPRPKEVTIDADLGYASRRYRIPNGVAADWRMVILPAAPPSTRGAVVFPIEDAQWQVTLGGYAHDYPPTDEPGFMEFAKSLSSPLLHQAICTAEPLSEIHGWRQMANRWRQFERLSRWPEGFVVVGDSVRAFNPVYGQGLTVAAITAIALGHALSDHRRRHGADLTGFARRFQRLVARHGADAWQLATGEDLRYPTTQGPRPGRLGRLGYRYGDRVLAVANGHPEVQAAFLRVIHLLDRPATLVHPRVLLPVVAGRRAEPMDDPPTADSGSPAWGQPLHGSG
jgi:flavin-dependent dehydrogenase